MSKSEQVLRFELFFFSFVCSLSALLEMHLRHETAVMMHWLSTSSNPG